MTRREIEARMLAARREFNRTVKVRPVPKHTRKARLGTVFPRWCWEKRTTDGSEDK